jgi:hypothetical protein
VFYEQPDDDSLTAALEEFERVEASVQPAALQRVAQRFSEAAFHDAWRTLLAGVRESNLPPFTHDKRDQP